MLQPGRTVELKDLVANAVGALLVCGVIAVAGRLGRPERRLSLSLLIVAGEVSGDLHAGNLLAELRREVPDIEAFGVGGERLAGNGLDCVATHR